jgi:hypothetical protein
MECAEGRLSPVRERRRVRVTFKPPITLPNPAPSSSPLAKGRGGKRAHHFERRYREAQYPVAAPLRNHFKLCDFPLVTPSRLLY